MIKKNGWIDKIFFYLPRENSLHKVSKKLSQIRLESIFMYLCLYISLSEMIFLSFLYIMESLLLIKR